VFQDKVIGREPELTGIRGQDAITLPPNTATMDDCYRIGQLLYGSPPPSHCRSPSASWNW